MMSEANMVSTSKRYRAAAGKHDERVGKTKAHAGYGQNARNDSCGCTRIRHDEGSLYAPFKAHGDASIVHPRVPPKLACHDAGDNGPERRFGR